MSTAFWCVVNFRGVVGMAWPSQCCHTVPPAVNPSSYVPGRCGPVGSTEGLYEPFVVRKDDRSSLFRDDDSFLVTPALLGSGMAYVNSYTLVTIDISNRLYPLC